MKMFFLQFMLLCKLNTRWYYSSNQWSYTQYQNNYSWHSDRVQSDNNCAEGGRRVMTIKEYKEMTVQTEKRRKKERSSPPASLIMSKPRRMLQLLCIYIRSSNKNALHRPKTHLLQTHICVFQRCSQSESVPYSSSFLMYLKQATSI